MTRFCDHLRERGQVSTVTCGGCGRAPMDKEQQPDSPKCQSERAAEPSAAVRNSRRPSNNDPVGQHGPNKKNSTKRIVAAGGGGGGRGRAGGPPPPPAG